MRALPNARLVAILLADSKNCLYHPWPFSGQRSVPIGAALELLHTATLFFMLLLVFLSFPPVFFRALLFSAVPVHFPLFPSFFFCSRPFSSVHRQLLENAMIL